MVAAIGSIIGGIGSVVQLSYQRAIANANAKQQEYNAEAAREAAGYDVKDIAEQGRGEAGSLVSSQGASGFAASSPSFVSGVNTFLTRVYESGLRRAREGNQQFAAYTTQANIERTRGKMFGAAIPFALAGSFFNAAASAYQPSSFFGAAQPSMLSPSYIPLPRVRPRLNPGGVGYGQGPYAGRY